MRKFILTIVIFFCFYSSLNSEEKKCCLPKKVIGLDYFYNNEWIIEKGKPIRQFHYIWEDTEMSGFSEFGKIFQHYGAEIVSVKHEPTLDDLDPLSIYIIVDPDTPQETEKPHYLGDSAIQSITTWVENGGVLMLMGNNKGNAEFKHFNNLAQQFGITFNKNSRNVSTDSTLYVAEFTTFPGHPIFAGVKKLYIKGICTLKVKPPAEAIYTDRGGIIMALAHKGKGTVFAIGDPWFYNEYIDFKDYNNRTAAMNLIPWLLEKAQPVK